MSKPDWKKLRDKRVQRLEKLGGLKALLAEHLAMVEPDVDYIKDLKNRVRSLEANLQSSGDDPYNYDS